MQKFYRFPAPKTTQVDIPLPPGDQALPGRNHALPITEPHRVLGRPLKPPYPESCQEAVLGLGCFWGAERLFWQQPGVHVTAVGYSGGLTPNPTYQEVCSGLTGHAEVVRIIFDPEAISYSRLLELFWEGHDPTQGMRQGNDIGTQYRSMIQYQNETQRTLAEQSREHYQRRLAEKGIGPITTQIVSSRPFYFAEQAHQQYLALHPDGYCGLGGCGVPFQ
ncbi:MAG: peptide-methionine (S)-S-oxide reductase MsrA [Gammaproteobacteria bacterium]|nr:MAG: peptide-methionine (S)-S-oxide reductase MsrA [Gammaproteobacteria bacterium]